MDSLNEATQLNFGSRRFLSVKFGNFRSRSAIFVKTKVSQLHLCAPIKSVHDKVAEGSETFTFFANFVLA